MSNLPTETSISPLTSLPAELQNAIVQFLGSEGPENLVHLSSTCSSYRDLLAPYIFEVVSLKNTNQSGSSICAIANGKHREFVKELRYTGEVSEEESDDEEAGGTPVDQALVTDTKAILSDLTCFPNLQKLAIELPVDWDEKDYYEYAMDDLESSEQVIEAETNVTWRALMAQSWDALAQNRSVGFEQFEIINLEALRVSSFESEAFHRFLGSFKQVSISMKSWENGAGWNLNTMPGWLPWAEKLGEWFFDHLHNVTDFVLLAAETAPIGLHPGRYHPRLAFIPDVMPNLRTLELGYVFLCQELIGFITAHSTTLESIVLRDCMADMQPMDVDTEGVSWSEFFNALVNADSKRLKHFVVEYTEDIEIKQSYDESDDSPDLLAVRKALKSDSNRRLFNYTNLDDKYGMLFHDVDQNIEAFLEGNDQRAYDNLMAIVAANISQD